MSDTGSTSSKVDASTGAGSADADRGNLDGSTPSNGPREDSLDQAKGNGSFDDADSDDSDEARMASDAGESGQDAGSMS